MVIYCPKVIRLLYLLQTLEMTSKITVYCEISILISDMHSTEAQRMEWGNKRSLHIKL